MAKATRKHLSRSEARKLKPGTWVRVWWNDADDEVALLIEKDNAWGWKCFFPDRTPKTNKHTRTSMQVDEIDFDQIVKSYGNMVVHPLN